MTVDEERVSALELEVKRLQIEYDRYFNGSIALPPEQARMRIQEKIQQFRSAKQMKSVALRFRLNSLEARFSTVCVLFNRKMRERETGLRRQARSLGFDQQATQPEASEEPRGPSAEEIGALYKQYDAKCDPSQKTDPERFETFVRKQYERIRENTGCKDVRFRIADDDGKVKLKARPV